MMVNDYKVCEGLSVKEFSTSTSEGGRLVMGPAAGNGNGSNLNNTGSNGNYWSSTPNSDNSNNAWNLNFKLKVKHYGRYVDDLFIVGESKEYVKSMIEPIRRFLSERLKLELSESKTQVCNARHGVEFLGAFIKPFRTYAASRTLRRIRSHVNRVSPRMNIKRAQAVVNSSLGVLSHYDSYCVRRVTLAKSLLTRWGRISEDGLRYYPNILDWTIYRSENHLQGEKL